MIDVATIKAQRDLTSQIEKDLGPPSKVRKHRVYWRCPFHDDHHPSLEVNQRQERWYCPPCKLSGDVISWVQNYHGLDFVAACEYLSAEVGRVPTRTERHRPIPLVRKRHQRATEPASNWQKAAWKVVKDCKRVLWSSDGARARRYLHDRGLDDDTLRRWHIGYCPNDGF